MRQLFLCIIIAGLLAGQYHSRTFQEEEVIGFLGDSITHAEYSEVNYTHVLYNYYVTHMPEQEIELRNLGVGGAGVTDGLELYKKDPAASGLDRIVLEYGLNDLKGRLYENIEIYEGSQAERVENLEEYKEGLSTFLKTLEDEGIEKEAIWITTLPIPVNDAKEEAASLEGVSAFAQEGFQQLSGIAREVAKKQGVGLVELQIPLTELEKALSKEEFHRTIMWEDLLHLNTDGQIYLAYLFLQQQGALKDVSNVEIQKGKIDSKDAEVSNLHYKEGYLYYDYQAKRLPMGISDEYYEADESLGILDKINREIIKVQDLQADAIYDIYINGELIGSYNGEDFADGVNIANIKENPAQRFASIVEQMNRGRRVSELAYRKKVQDSTDCGSNKVTEEELIKAYEVWQEEDLAYRKNMYELVQGEIQVTERIAIVQQGVEEPAAAFRIPGRDYKKVILVIFMIGITLGGLFYWKEKKKKQQ